MNLTPTGARSRWVWAAVGATAAVAAVLWLVSRSRPPAPPNAVATRSSIGLQKLAPGSALDDEATLFDPTPLFQPTQWNTAQKDIAPPEPSGTFQSYRVPAKLGFAESDLGLGRTEPRDIAAAPAGVQKIRNSINLPEVVAVPRKPSEALVPGVPGALLVGFGRLEAPVAALSTRGALVEIDLAGSGQPALTSHAMAQVQVLAAAARPPGNRAWQVMEFIAAVDASGLAAPLMMTARSGVEEVDLYFQNFLVKTVRVGERLGPGFYRISVGP